MRTKVAGILVAALIIATIPVMLIFCGKMKTMKTKTDDNRITLPSIAAVPKGYWAKLAEKRIFFGHQSVGYNIIDGIKDVISEYDHIRLNIVETQEPSKFDQPIFAHARVGKNMEPVSKIEGFKNIMDAGAGNKVDIAFLKFCYIDVMRDSDPQRILDDYSSAIEDLKVRYPKTKFLHVTVPICSRPKSIKRALKESIKRLIGRPGVLDDNKMRQCYNTLLKDAYSQKEPIFDLALIESVNPIGCRYYATKGTAKVCVMVPEYTDDGGHLNKLGRKRVAEQLLIVLAQIANNP
jgi:hypothetical protein